MIVFEILWLLSFLVYSHLKIDRIIFQMKKTADTLQTQSLKA